jgi:hypothetical protein
MKREKRMIRSVRSLHFVLYFLIAALFLPGTVLCDEGGKNYQPENAVIEASKEKAKELGYNPIPVYMKEGDDGLSITGGAILQVKNFRQTFVEGDMVINVGELSVPFVNFPLLDDFNAPRKIILSKGEYAVLKDGQFAKQTGKIKVAEAKHPQNPVKRGDTTTITITGRITNIKKAKEFIAHDSYLQLVCLPPGGKLGGTTDNKGREKYDSDLPKIDFPSNGDFTLTVKNLEPGKYIIAAQLLESFGLGKGGSNILAIRKTKQIAIIDIPDESKDSVKFELDEVFLPVP